MTTRGARATASTVALGFVTLVVVLVACGTFVVHVLAHSALGHFEMAVPGWLAARRTTVLNGVTAVASRSGDTPSAIAIALVVACVCAIRRHWRFVAMLATGLALELCTFLAVNTVVARPRPHVAHIASVPTTSSFPSGHVAAALVIYATLARYVTDTVRPRWAAWLAWCVGVVAPAFIAFARVYRGVHYPTDVIFGLLMGASVVVIVAVAFARGAGVDAEHHAFEPTRTAERAAA